MSSVGRHFELSPWSLPPGSAPPPEPALDDVPPRVPLEFEPELEPFEPADPEFDPEPPGFELDAPDMSPEAEELLPFPLPSLLTPA